MDSTLTIHDGHQASRYWPRHRQYVVSTDVPTAAESPLRWLLDLVRGVASATYQRSEVLDVDGVRHRCYVVDVTYDRSPSELPRLTEARLWVDEETRLVVQSVFRVLTRRSTGETVIGEETTIWTDRRMSPPQGDLFAFHPQPGDVQVEEFHEPAAAAIGTSALEFAGVDLDGRDVSLSSLRGRVVVLAFWASWCLPCEPELRLLARFQSEFRDDGLVVLGINGENETVAR